MISSHGKLRTLVASAAVLGTGVAVIAVGPIAAFAAPASASDALTAAVSGLKGEGYNVTGTAGSTASGGTGQLNATGSVDPSATAATIEFKGTEGGQAVDLAFTQVDQALYAKVDIPPVQSQLGVAPDQWMQLDPSKITGGQAVPFDLSGSTDAFGVAGLLTSVSDVKYPDQSDPTTITGTVDLTAATGVGAPDKEDLTKAGTAAKTTPFTATLDSQGRLTQIKVNADGYDGDLSEDINYTDIGSPTNVNAPTSSIPAPAPAYQFFNN
jgi:hypothetical protein